MAAPSRTLYVLGRVHGVTARRLAEVAAWAGWRVARSPGARVDTVAIGEGSAFAAIDPDGALSLPPGLPQTVALVGEAALKRLLGLSAPPADEPRTLTADDLVRTSGLSREILTVLGLYDVVAAEDGRFRFKDLLAAREVRRLLDAGHALAGIVDAAVHLRRAGRSLADTRLGLDPDLDLDGEVTARVGDAAGQFRLDLRDRPESEDELFARAEAAEARGDLPSAERTYRLLLRLDRADPVIPFNLGNVLSAAGRAGEAMLAYREALTRDAAFAEAWLNLAVAAEERGAADEAERAYEAALRARPDYADALFSAALFQSRAGRPDRAAALWRRFLATGPSAADAAMARRQLRTLG